MPFRDAAHAVLKIAWWLWAAWFLVGFLRAFVVTEHRPREGKLIQDLLAGLDLSRRRLCGHRLCLRSADQGLARDLGCDRHHSRARLAEHVERRVLGDRAEFQPPLPAGRLDQHRRRHRRPGHRDELARNPRSDRQARSGNRAEQHDRQGENRQCQLAHPTFTG